MKNNNQQSVVGMPTMTIVGITLEAFLSKVAEAVPQASAPVMSRRTWLEQTAREIPYINQTYAAKLMKVTTATVKSRLEKGLLTLHPTKVTGRGKNRKEENWQLKTSEVVALIIEEEKL